MYSTKTTALYYYKFCIVNSTPTWFILNFPFLFYISVVVN